MTASSCPDAVVLAGGLGSRLRPVVDGLPKVLAPVAGRPFLAYVLEQLRAAGVQRSILCTGYRDADIAAAFGGSYRGMTIIYSHEDEPLGTAGALRNALPLVVGNSVLVLNGDSYCNVDLTAFVDWRITQECGAAVIVTRVDDVGRYGHLIVDRIGRVRSFEEKTLRGHAPAGRRQRGWINAGIYLIDRTLLQSIPSGRHVSLEREMFPLWLPEGLFAYRVETAFIDIGVPSSYRAAEVFFKSLGSAELGGCQ